MLLPAEEILLGEGGYHIECGIFEVRLDASETWLVLPRRSPLGPSHAERYSYG